MLKRTRSVKIGAKSTFMDTLSKLRSIIGIGEDTEVLAFFDQMLNSIGVKTVITGNLVLTREQRVALSNGSNSDRMTNNPVVFSDKQIRWIFEL